MQHSFTRYLDVGTIDLNSNGLLQLAWLCEQSACWQRHLGELDGATKLFLDASKLREAAVNN